MHRAFFFQCNIAVVSSANYRPLPLDGGVVNISAPHRFTHDICLLDDCKQTTDFIDMVVGTLPNVNVEASEIITQQFKNKNIN